jgi:N-acetylmuramoyl-L-alanine amidase
MRPVAFILCAALCALAAHASAAERKAEAAPAAKNTIALEARLAGDDKRTRLVVDLSREVPVSAFALADPYRVVIDLPGVSFDFAAGAGREGKGLVTAFRYGLIAPGKGRIVIDAREPVTIDKVYVLAPFESQPARLVVDLARTDRATFLKRAALQPRADAGPVKKNERAAATDPRPVVVIDPGHGGIDSGAVARGGAEEKEIVLAVALKLRDRLERGGRYKVILTRADDTFIPLADRVKVARNNAAALFISLHADAMRRDNDVRGATVFTVSDRASDAEAERVAERENKADLIAGIDLSDEADDVAGILFDLAHRETKNFSALFARTLVGQLKAATQLHATPIKSAGFKVLKAPDVPSVLVELGFLSNAGDQKQLGSEAWREKVADSMLASVEAFFATRMAAGQSRAGN